MADSLRSQENSRSISSYLNQSQDHIKISNPDVRPIESRRDSESLESSDNLNRSYTPSHLSFKTYEKNKDFALALRERSRSLPHCETPPPIPKKSSLSTSSALEYGCRNKESGSNLRSAPSNPSSTSMYQHSPLNTQGIISIMTETNVGKNSANQLQNKTSQRISQKLYRIFPTISDPKLAPKVQHTPPSSMYWSSAPLSGISHNGIRAHSSTIIGSNIYIFGGCDSRSCFNDILVLDADAFFLSNPIVCGDIPTPLRAMTFTAVGKKLIMFGGGDGPTYYNDVYVLDTVNFRWSKPKIGGDRKPSKRRAHTACLWRNGIYIFGGGDGAQALNDVWRLDVTDTNKMSWKLISPPTTNNSTDKSKPKARGYHTANMVSNKLIIYGGSDGGECFQDVWVFDVEKLTFTLVNTPISYPRLSHTATIVGSYLFVIGGHDGIEYSNDVLLLNLVTMVWDKRRIYGEPPRPRGYHGTALHDSRLIVIGGFDGWEVFSDVKVLELAVHAYYSQISHFSIDV